MCTGLESTHEMRSPDRIGAKGAEKDLSLQLGVALLQDKSYLVKAPEEEKRDARHES
jgi:hypothetical protein